MAISAIIITHEYSERLAMTLSALASSCAEFGEIILAVDLPEDERAVPGEVAERVDRIVWTGGGGGRAAVRNRGAAAARGELLLFLDGDMLVGPGFVAAHRARIAAGCGASRGRIRELLGAAARPCLREPGPGFAPLDPDRLAADGFDPAGYRIGISVLESAVEARGSGARALPLWLASAGPNLMIERSLWQRSGGWNEAFGTRWGCEDREFAYRLAAMAPYGLAPAATGYHLSHVQPDRWAEHRRAVAAFAALHADPAIDALPALLGPQGSVPAYEAAIGRHKRTP